jgi:hypothetical protein
MTDKPTSTVVAMLRRVVDSIERGEIELEELEVEFGLEYIADQTFGLMVDQRYTGHDVIKLRYYNPKRIGFVG